MSDKAEIDFEINDQHATRAWNGILTLQAKMVQELQRLTAESQKTKQVSEQAGSEQTRLWNEGQKLVEKHRSSVERMNAEKQRLVKLLGACTIGEKEFAAELKAIEEKYKEVDVVQEEFALEGKRLWEQMRTPLERYRAEMARLDEGLKRGTTDQETYNRKVRELKTEYAAVEQAARKAGRGSQDALSGAGDVARQAASQATQFVMALTGIGGVLGAIQMAAEALRAERENVQREQQASRIAAMDAGQAVRMARFNFAEDDTLKDAGLEAAIQRVAEDTRSTVPVVAAAAEAAFSAKGSATNEQAMEAVAQALRIDPTNAAAAAEFASRVLDVGKYAPDSSIKARAGFIQQMQANSRVVSMQQTGQNLMPAVGSLVQLGDTPEEAAEIVAAVNNFMQDARGEMSRTAAIQLAAQLTDFVPRPSGKDDRGTFRVPQEQIDEFLAAQGPSARLAVVQRHPELQRAAEAEFNFEAASKSYMRSLLRGTPEAMAMLGTARKGIGGVDAAAPLFDAKIEELDRGLFQDPLTVAQQAAANLEKSRLLDPLGQRVDSVREIVRGVFGRVNAPGLDSGFWGTRKLGRESSIEDALEAAFEQNPNQDPATAGRKALETYYLPHIEGRVSRAEEQLVRDQIELLRRMEGHLQKVADRPLSDPSRPPGARPASALGR